MAVLNESYYTILTPDDVESTFVYKVSNEWRSHSRDYVHQAADNVSVRIGQSIFVYKKFPSRKVKNNHYALVCTIY